MFTWLLPKKSFNADFVEGYKVGVEDEFRRCQQSHQEIIDDIQRFYIKTLGPRKFVEIQKLYAQSKKT